MGAGAYKVKLPDSFRQTSATFNKALLTPFKPPAFESQKQPPPPDPVEVDGQQEWEVERIKDVKWTNKLQKTVRFLVHWKGFTDEEDTWEPIQNLEDAQETIQEFYANHSDKPKVN